MPPPAPLAGPSPTCEAPLVDGQGRALSYLRLSLTDRCNLRCSYCSPPSLETRSPPLTADEILRLATALIPIGVRRIRLTGGEPTARRELVDIVRRLSALPDIEEICLTTNGLLLERLARPLFEAGIRALNISLDTLDPGKYARGTGGGDLGRVFRGIDAARWAGFRRIKLNAVVLAGVNEDDVAPLIRFAWDHALVPRFIEHMPFGEGSPVPTATILSRLEAQGLVLTPEEEGPHRLEGPSEYWVGEGGKVGFIGPMTRNFCHRCNRLRISARGELRACLGGREAVPLRPLLAEGIAPREIVRAVRAAVRAKPARHSLDEGARLGTMLETGG
jgi:cyclic pyranopterin phosphate synthase